jgi:dipeptidyl aminopeptidase/acylaminoacyl peptidase
LPLGDTDGNGRLGPEDRTGLQVFDGDGRPRIALPPTDLDLTDPVFSPDGRALAFVAGCEVRRWTLEDGDVEVMWRASTPGVFPRLAGWETRTGLPLFTQGIAYRQAGLDGHGRYRIPREGPIYRAGHVETQVVTPPGAQPLRRGRLQINAQTIFYLANTPEAGRALFGVGPGPEEAWTPAGEWVYAFAPDGAGNVWALVGRSRGEAARLVRFTAPHQGTRASIQLVPHMMGLAVDGTGCALITGIESGASTGGWWRVDASGRSCNLAACKGMWYYPAAAGTVACAVVVSRDTDGDGDLSPLDVGELWVLGEVS